MGLFSIVMASLGSILAKASSTGCIILVFDEPICPKELIK